MTCELCDGPLHPTNTIGVCKRTLECIRENKRRHDIKRDVCGCGKPKRKGAKRCSECYRASLPDRRINEDGYVLVASYDHPRRSPRGPGRRGWVREHIVVMEGILGRYLLPGEEVHHKDTRRDNNEPGNLQLRIGRHGKGGVFACLDCGSHNIVAEEIA